ncbi:MAG: site-specific DNA-methyltransferase [Chloroflexota bacterium]|nr:site-specific DNA-methyltransferase [Chloroflexota bacterium]MDE2907606.1 site-specific DNA-methyltransferase [Chloroflexota bacterium]
MPTLEFKGKNHIYAHHLTVPYRPLQLDESRSLLPESDNGKTSLTDQNLIIHGDNLEALKALLPHYAGRVKCIYIDPPYNTGNEVWHYNDNVNSPMMQDWLKKHGPVDGEDLERHDKWLCMMWPRLHLLRELLSDDGVIFISIDYNEEHHLRMLMDELFGEVQYRNTFVVARVKKNIREREKIRALNFGYNSLLFYGKSDESLIVPPTKFQKKKVRWHAFDAPGIRQTMEYELFGMQPPEGRHWMYSEDRAVEMIDAGRLRPNPRSGKPQYLLDESNQTMLDTNWTDLQEYDSKFNFPYGEKNVELIHRLVGMIDDKDAVILDSFAGSGTTAHAVLALNQEDGGNRRFILVECEDYADSITAERVRRVIRGVPTAKNTQLKEGLGGSFAYCTLGEAIDVDSLLEGDELPSYSDLASYLLHTATGISASTQDLQSSDEDGRFYSSDETDYYLIYAPSLEFLRSGDAALNLERAERIRDKGRSAVVFAAAKFISQSELSKMGITFCQLPYELGLGVS